MKKEPKILSILLLCGVLLFSLCGCEGKPVIPQGDNVQKEPQEETQKETPKEDLKVDEEKDPPATIAETVIYEGNDVIIKVMGCEESSIGFEVNLYIENNSNLSLGFNAHSYAVNGTMTNNNIYDMDCDVAAGKKANTVLTIKQNVLDNFEIGKVRTIDVLFWAYDNDKMFKAFDTDQIKIVTSYNDDTRNIFQGKMLYDNEGIQVEYLGTTDDGCTYGVTNRTGTYLSFDVEDISINDYTVTDMNFELMNVSALNECQAIVMVPTSSEFLTKNGIQTVENIEFALSISPRESYEGEWKTEAIITESP